MNKKTVILFGIAVVLLINIKPARAADWYDAGWGYRKMITVDYTKVGAALTDFAVLINVTDTDLKDISNSGHVTQADGGDILFTDSSGTVKLDHEIEKYTNTIGELVAWVEVASLSSTVDTYIYIYYGGPSTPDQWNINGTWESSLAMVQHLKEDPSGGAPQMIDSTSNANNGDSNGSMITSQQVSGKINGSLRFIYDDDNINVGQGSSLDITGNQITIEAWICPYAALDTDSSYIVSKYNGVSFINAYSLLVTSSILRFRLGNGITTYLSNPAYVMSSYDWYHMAAVCDGSSMGIYVNGSYLSDSTTAFSGNIGSNAVDVVIGQRSDIGTPSYLFNGIIDEVRVYNRGLTAQEISTQYNNQNSPSTFLSFASEEPYYWRGGSYDGHSMSGTAGDVAVGYGDATKLDFTTPPSNAFPGDIFVTQPVVTIQDADSNTVTTATDSITLSISNNPGGGTLSGTNPVAAVSGLATFSGLNINKQGDGYTLQAAAAGLASATSSSFNVLSHLTITNAITTVQTQVTNVQTDVTSILQDTGTTLPATLSTIEGKIDTMSANVDAILVDTGTTLPGTLTAIEGKVDTIDTVVDAILVDTGTDLPAAITTAKTDIIAELDKGVKSQILNRETSVITGDTITIRYKTASSLSPTIDVYDADNVKRVNAASMSEIGSTGVYEYDLTLASGWGTGDFTVICSETTKSSIDSMVLAVTTSGASVDLGAIETKVDTLTANLNTLDTNVDSVQAVVGTISDTTASSTLYGRLSGVTSNVSAIVTKWGSYTADDLIGNTSDLENYLGTPDDAASEDTVFGKIAAIDSGSDDSGLTSTTAIYAQNAYDEIQKLRDEIDFNGKTDTAYNILVGLKDTVSGLRERIDKIPSEAAAHGSDDVVNSLNEALSALKEKAALAGYPGVAAEAEELETKAGEGALDLKTLKNQLSELKALLETVKGLMEAGDEKPVIESWLEMGG
jgi:hypothetical protein